MWTCSTYTYVFIIYLALNDLHKYDTSQFPVTTGSDIITLDVSFLLCSSGIPLCTYIHVHIHM